MDFSPINSHNQQNEEYHHKVSLDGLKLMHIVWIFISN